MTRRAGISHVNDLRARCRVDPITDCWHWTGATDRGLPAMWHAPTRTRTTMTGIMRLLLEDDPGPTMHWYAACGNPRCGNPAHRKAGTRSELQRTLQPRKTPAQRAAVARGKHAQPGSRYNAETAAAIRGSDEILRVLAERHGLSISMVSRIRMGKAWAVAPQGASVFGWRP